ncbi:bifunctional hydroxymethylpyrimidine kinase/phosphomethylpyrimidine kinase [Fodinicurvata sediminis]|uniref:bifunctional hydroxymethylpyrimidine kinase/phosphomethylpyrimidine kinase n=1 Tax=Fodinicurvata sediminis TaxID=1121832 RepID=UPI0003B79316|nr:bifunctional hydroxymethylpyrimidine kinase/phosphomethylpyrimidine kinase [Fodinicurvata sediminis]
MKGRVLIIAGSDSGGGAGIQADIKTVTALQGYAATAITALTAQNTQGVHGVFGVDPDFIAQQIQVVLQDIGADSLKTGMLHSPAVIETVARELQDYFKKIPLILDPVMVAQSGANLLEPEAVENLKNMLLPLADILTPNVPEAEKLTGMQIVSPEQMQVAARSLLEMGPRSVLLKGGHLEGEILYDVLATPEGVEVFSDMRIDTRQTHGTGCTLASAIATGLAQGLTRSQAVARARAYLQRALKTAPGYGQGEGGVDHAHTVGAFQLN